MSLYDKYVEDLSFLSDNTHEISNIQGVRKRMTVDYNNNVDQEIFKVGLRKDITDEEKIKIADLLRNSKSKYEDYVIQGQHNAGAYD